MKNTGIWLDKEKAFIVTLEDEREIMSTIYSDVEDYHITSNKFFGGAQEVVPDRKFLEREKNQLKSYFKDIASRITDDDAIVIFGPAETKDKFWNELQENYNQLSSKIKGVEKADSMTENQVKAWVREFFKPS